MAQYLATGSVEHHAAFTTAIELSMDTYDPLFDWFFETEPFTQWRRARKGWQLHCCGGPGSGKTTIAMQAAERLRSWSKNVKSSVAFVSVNHGTEAFETFLIEDLLTTVYDQIRFDSSILSSHDSELDKDCRDPSTIHNRQASCLDILRESIRTQLRNYTQAYLIFDGYDRLSKTTRSCLEPVLRQLQTHGLNILITRRVPSYEKVENLPKVCDNCSRDDLQVYWRCTSCNQDGLTRYFDLCYTCKDMGSKCTTCDENTSFQELYDHVDIQINLPESSLRSFIFWDFWREYKTLHLRMHPKDIPNTNSADYPISYGQKKLLDTINKNSGGNITLAKFGLEELHRLRTWEGVEHPHDRIMPGIVDFFDACIQQIESQVRIMRDLALLTIYLAARDDVGIELRSVQDHIQRMVNGGMSYMAHMLPLSLVDVLEATKGLLVLVHYDSSCMACYNLAFRTYVLDDYNEALYEVKTMLSLNRAGATQGIRGPRRILDEERQCTSPPTVTNSSPPPDSQPGTSTIHRDSGYFSRAPSSIDNTINSGAKVFHKLGVRIPPSNASPQQEHGNSSVLSITRETAPHAVPSPKNVCQSCLSSIIQGEELHGPHHDTLQSLHSSAMQNCVFCSRLYTDISNMLETVPMLLYPGQWPLYYWTIRTAAMTTKSHGSVTVRMRPTDVIHTGLHTRTFHLIQDDNGDLCYGLNASNIADTTDPLLSGGVQIKEWMQRCVHTHQYCPKPSSSDYVPTRLVDTATGNPNTVRIVDTKGESIKGPYTTLSHSWGPKSIPFLTLTTKNKNELMTKGVELTSLSNNFRQAVAVTRHIGIRYIWIDSLCIIQGSDGDFKTQGQFMHKVYKFSYCNIAAADSVDSRGGLFRDRNGKSLVPVRYHENGRSKMLAKGDWVILEQDLWEREVLDSCIYKRGWVFQERMLAPRILHFTCSQIYWDCCTLSASEALPLGLPSCLDASARADRHWRARLQIAHKCRPVTGAADDSLEEFWRAAVAKYTSCDLTNQGDKTVAIWSVAKLVRDAFNLEYDWTEEPQSHEEYGGGMWKSALVEQLAWKVQHALKSSRPSKLQQRFPSWSWASVKGTIVASSRLPVERTYVATDHAANDLAFELKSQKQGESADGMMPEDKEPELKSKWLEIQTHVTPVALSGPQGEETYDLGIQEPESIEGATLNAIGQLDVFLDEILTPADLSHGNVYIAVLATTEEDMEGSIFEEVASSDDGFSQEARYSGIALLLTKTSSYIRLQEDRLHRWEDHISGSAAEHDHPANSFSLAKEISDLRDLLQSLDEQAKQGGIEGHYRRIGTVHFSDVDADTWAWMQGGEVEKFWLD